jgi:hypothetical protein
MEDKAKQTNHRSQIQKIRNKLIRNAFNIYKSKIEEDIQMSTKKDIIWEDLEVPEEDKPNELPLGSRQPSRLVNDKGQLKRSDLVIFKAFSCTFRKA